MTTLATAIRDLVMDHYAKMLDLLSPDIPLRPPEFTLSLRDHGDDGVFVRLDRDGRFEEGGISWGVGFTVHRSPTLHIDDTAALSEHFDVWMRQERRAVTIGRDLTLFTPPRWTLRMPRVLRRLVEHATGGGVVPELVKEGRSGRLYGGYEARVAPGGLQAYPMKGDFRIHRDRFDAHDEIEFGEREVRGTTKPVLTYRGRGRPDHGHGPLIILDRVEIPDTMVSAINAGGMDIGDLIDHPAFGGAIGVPITAVKKTDSRLRIELGIVEDWLGAPPRGANTHWMRLGSTA